MSAMPISLLPQLLGGAKDQTTKKSLLGFRNSRFLYGRYIGFEVVSLVAVLIGPRLLILHQAKQLAMTTAVYGGLLILPYFRYTYMLRMILI